MSWTLLIPMIVLLLVAVAMQLRSRRQRADAQAARKGSCVQETVLCEKERFMHAMLQQAFPSHIVLASVPASLVVSVRGGSRLAMKRDVLRRWILDFVVLNANGEACYVFEIGRSMPVSRGGAYSEDAYVAKALERAGVTLFRVSRISARLTPEKLRGAVEKRNEIVRMRQLSTVPPDSEMVVRDTIYGVAANDHRSSSLELRMRNTSVRRA